MRIALPSDVYSLLFASAVAGIAATPHCVGMCGPFACRGGLSWHVGRLGGYALLGAAAGTTGSALTGPGWWGPAVGVVLAGVAAVRLAGGWRGTPVHIPGVTSLGRRLARLGGPWGGLGLGVLAALLPCGMLHSALVLPALSGDPGWGTLAMVAFGLGNLPGLWATDAIAGWLRKQGTAQRRALAALVFFAAVVAIAGRSPMKLGDQGVCHGTPLVGSE